MTAFYEECKKWISMAQSMELDNLEKCLKSLNKSKGSDQNKNLFKLLLHMSHCADRCRKEKLSNQVQLYKITKTICDSLTEVPDKNKLFSAVFYIVIYLLEKECYKEAQVITNYVLPGNLLKDNDLLDGSKYQQLSVLWLNSLGKKFENKWKEIKTKEEVLVDTNLCELIQFHLSTLDYCDDKDGFFLKTLDAYFKKFSDVPLKESFPYVFIVIQKAAHLITNLKEYAPADAYSMFIPLIGSYFFKKSENLNSVLDYYRKCDIYFVDCLKKSAPAYNCYKFFREYTINLFETNFMSVEIGARFDKACNTLDIITEKYGSNNHCLIETMAAISSSFDTIFNKWENVVMKKFVNTKLTNENIVTMGKFVKKFVAIYKNRRFNKNYICKKCPNNTKCHIETEIFNAASFASSYVKVLTKYTLENMNDEIFSCCSSILEELLAIFNKLDESNCRYVSPMWAICGRTIFNFGLISEGKYSAQLIHLYELLCKEVIKRDGLNSQVSSFGLENPVATALHRLCNANFNQEKFENALVYTAYNALLSINETRKRKACDMWASLKLKLIENEKIQKLTLLECLRKDTEVATKLGIKLDLSTYDLKDLCLRELKSLLTLKSNVTVAMKETIAELEIINHPIGYAQGVLLLCFHSMQLISRDYILDYINKALEKLKKLKTPVAQCMVANLKFFVIIEEFKARTKAICEQMDDASFTVKSFKIIQGIKNDDLEKQEEIVPTYGGITIEEDNKYSQRMRNCLDLWEMCIQKHSATIIEDWEPKFTLETILICGEYCRLYKFSIVEASVWRIAHKLATDLNDSVACIYVTSRSVSIRSINENWIKDAENRVETIKNSSKAIETDAVILFLLSLADFYFDCNMIEKGKELLDRAEKMNFYDMLANAKLFIYATEIKFRNYYLINTDPSQEDYCKFLVEIHYSMINLHDILQEPCRFWNIKYFLMGMDQLLETMCTIVIPMNSLLSFREIIAHLTYGLAFAQKHGITLRIAQLLKYHINIDLLRLQIEQCETRLQDLEHILCLENFQKSMKTRLPDEISSENFHPGVRDAGITMSRNNASPELKKKLFDLPSFIDHSSRCECAECTNLLYQYLVFTCAHQRAQLYSIMNYPREAEQHFHSASVIKAHLDDRDTDKVRQHKMFKWKRKQEFVIDRMLCMLDLSMFIIDFKSDRKDDALMLIEEVLEIAKESDLTKHCVTVYAMELYFQHHVYELFEDKTSISVPHDIPITITNKPTDGCTTPKQAEKPVSRNRRGKPKSPTPVPVPVIIIQDDSPVDNKTKDKTTKTENAEAEKKSAVPRVNARKVRRKILVDEVDETTSSDEQTITVRRSGRLMKKSLDGPQKASQ
ncbi:uncharacterized protein LOC106652711 [Trichogramma pretiosum]|uniref:uncharacterized protein LOC106652711 n=1 Tax=Trichogramma pretiosum TaxID=7493 RepID=UPI0006C9678F|nr:uncharacterized protein LOC106652711 [Trichogramma pretiosum]